MKWIKSFLGYSIAVFCIFFAAATFLSNGLPGRAIVKSAGLSVSPWLIGGDTINTIDHGEYQTVIHAPVFKGLVFERKKGFVQIDWIKKERLPDSITESIDFDNDGNADFNIVYAHRLQSRPEVVSANHNLLPRMDVFERDLGYTIRIWMKR